MGSHLHKMQSYRAKQGRKRTHFLQNSSHLGYWGSFNLRTRLNKLIELIEQQFFNQKI